MTTGLAERLDLLVELATLGEYGLSPALRPVALSAESEGGRLIPRTRGRCEARPAAPSARDVPTLS